PAPAGFAASLTVTALTNASGGTTTAPFSKLLTLTNMKTSILAIALAGVIAGLGYRQLTTQRQLREARSSAEHQAEEIQALRTANEQLVNQTNDLKRLRAEANDVLRLRAEVVRLRQEHAALNRTAAQIAQAATNNTPKAEESSILITAKFISVPTERLK